MLIPICAQINIKFRKYSFQRGPAVTVQHAIRDEIRIGPLGSLWSVERRGSPGSKASHPHVHSRTAAAVTMHAMLAKRRRGQIKRSVSAPAAAFINL